jgi:uncharacterized cofD-like protein
MRTPLKIVSIGGGTGLSTLLRGLKRLPVELSAIVAVTDDGGSSGRLREELGVLPPGDIRNCMLALSEDEALMSRLFRHRFSGQSDGGLHDHSFGNLFLTAMADVTGDFGEAVRLTSEVLAIKGTIYPATTTDVVLRAQFDDGRWVEGETRITEAIGRLLRLEMRPRDAPSLPEALEAIRDADLITLGPGSLYTSLIANLLPVAMVPAIRASRGLRVYVQNIMTQPAETSNMTMSEHVRGLIDHCGDVLFPTALVNTRRPSEDLLRKYQETGSSVVEVDHARIAALGVTLVERDLLSEDETIRHDPDRLARAVVELWENSQS